MVTRRTYCMTDSQTQQLQMQAMSNQNVAGGATETQQMRVLAPAGVSCVWGLRARVVADGIQAQIRLRMRISFVKDGQNVTDQQDFSGFPADLTVAK